MLLNRLPNRFIAPGPDGRDSAVRQIGQLATDLDDDDAFVDRRQPRRRVHRLTARVGAARGDAA